MEKKNGADELRSSEVAQQHPPHIPHPHPTHIPYRHQTPLLFFLFSTDASDSFDSMLLTAPSVLPELLSFFPSFPSFPSS
jgi:hypothetical protein